MNVFVLSLLVSVTVGASGHTYLHVPSHSIMRSAPQHFGSKLDDDFGFSIAYQHNYDKDKNRLIIGAPHSTDRMGHIYTCSVEEQNLDKYTFKSIIKTKCEKLEIDFGESKDYNYLHQKQSNCLGASVAATKDYFVTCAPLLYKKLYMKKNELSLDQSIVGQCYIADKNLTYNVYKGLAEQESDAVRGMNTPAFKNREYMLGGTGWKTLADDRTSQFLMSKPMEKGDIVYLNLNETRPYWRAKSLALNGAFSNKQQLSDHFNVGFGLAAGKFFNDSLIKHYITYAFSFEDTMRNGEIAFVKADTDLDLLRNPDGAIVKIRGDLGVMFGAALSAADVNKDGLDDLFVGAPAYSDDDSKFNIGAVFIYLGGNLKTIGNEKSKRVIVATENGSGFGSSIAANDLDGDGIPEIFVSAPYERYGAGTLYVLSGYELNALFKDESNREIWISDLRHTQRIQINNFKTFGYSLKVIGDTNDNGCKELAVGTPRNSSVILLKCITAFTVNLELTSSPELSVTNKEFNVHVCVKIEYFGKKPETVTGILLLQTSVTGQADVKNHNIIEVNLSPKQIRPQCADVPVTFRDNDSGEYNFTVKLNTGIIETAFISKEFDNRWVNLQPQTIRERSILVYRRCTAPDFEMSISWNGRSLKTEEHVQYQLGSKKVENITVLVKSKSGNMCNSCVRILINGTWTSARAFVNIKCGPDENGTHRCQLPKTMSGYSQTQFIELNMDELSNLDDIIVIQVGLYPECKRSVMTKTFNLTFNLESNVDDIKVQGLSHNLHITDTMLYQASKNKTYTQIHEYTILNKRRLTWHNVTSEVILEKIPAMHNYKISTFENNKCSQTDHEEKVIFACPLEILPNSTTKIILTVELVAAKISFAFIILHVVYREISKSIRNSEKILVNMQTIIPSTFSEASLLKNDIEIKSSITVKHFLNKTIQDLSLNSVIYYKEEMTVGNKKYIIIIIAIIVATLILGAIIFILYKLGFFKRKSKELLDEYKQSVIVVGTNNLNTSNQPDMNSTPEQYDDIEMEVVEYNSFELVESEDCVNSDDTVLVKTDKYK